jgi:hypothetical protein
MTIPIAPGGAPPNHPAPGTTVVPGAPYALASPNLCFTRRIGAWHARRRPDPDGARAALSHVPDRAAAHFADGRRRPAASRGGSDNQA